MSRSLSLPLPPVDERVGEDHRSGAPAGEVVADQGHGVVDRGGVGALGQLPGDAHQLGLQVGDAVEGDVVDHHRLTDPPRIGAQVNARDVDQVGAEAQAARRVVVAADHHGADALGGQPPQCLVAQIHRVDRGQPPVDAVDLCNQALRRLAAERVRTVVISGNHDSARRLGFGADLIDVAGVHLRTDPGAGR